MKQSKHATYGKCWKLFRMCPEHAYNLHPEIYIIKPPMTKTRTLGQGQVETRIKKGRNKQGITM